MDWRTYLVAAALSAATLTTPIIGKTIVVHCLTWPRDDTLNDGQPLPLLSLDDHDEKVRDKHVLVESQTGILMNCLSQPLIEDLATAKRQRRADEYDKLELFHVWKNC
eukprot:scaffold162_cov176-Amphora_coffeaeformis.AAC.51